MWKALSVATLLLALPLAAHAEPTAIAVRTVAKGAKFIGSGMGGVRVTIADASTGELLAEGVITGSTGDTGKLMTEKLPRLAPRATEGSAVFATTLDVDTPRMLRVTARGPLGQPQGMAEASTTLWLAPGMPVTGGDAVLLELPGFVVDVVQPVATEAVAVGKTVTVHANVVMMCGCPLQPGGLWDSSKMKFLAFVYRDGREIARVPARYAGQANHFEAKVPVKKAGSYQVTFVAHDPRDGNTGVDSVVFSAK